MDEECPIQANILTLRQRMSDQLILRACIVAGVGVPLSLSRMGDTGWLPVYGIHIGIGLLVAVMFVFRRFLSTSLKIAVICSLCWALGIAGLWTFGLVGGGVLWLLIGCLMLSTLYSSRAGALSFLMAMLYIVYVGNLYSSEILKLPFDVAEFVVQPSTWFTALVATAIAPFMLLSAISMMQEMTESLLGDVEAQRKKIERLALYDDITGLPTFRLARDRLKQAMETAKRNNSKAAVLFLDLDNFKAVNDAFGHDAGDDVLKSAGQRIAECLRAEDSVSRRSGDEYLIVLPEVSGREAAADVAHKILSQNQQPMPWRSESIGWRNENMVVGASCGIAVFPDDATEMSQLLDLADASMYEAKRRGKNRVSDGTEKTVRESPTGDWPNINSLNWGMP